MENKGYNKTTLSPGDMASSKIISRDASPKKAAAENKPTLKMPSDYQDSPLSKSMDFVNETKYVMLNFMSLVPPEMYTGHVSSPSLGSASSGHDSPVSPHFRQISKSKSFDIGLHSHKPHSRRVGRLKSGNIDYDSQHSEDNITNRYQWYRLESPDEGRFNSDPGSPLDLPFEHSSHINTGYQSSSSTQLSPHKPMYLARSQSSVVSSSGDLSYVSDADDERDDFSNASSIFSSHSLHNRDGFLDLRKSVHVLPPLYSQSEETDGIDGPMADDGDHVVDKSEENEGVDEADIDNDNAEGSDVAGFIESRQRPVADRSKLKLNIPCEPVMLDDILVSLQTELSSEIDELESEFEDALKSARLTPLTPQSEAARVLARIGDEVKEQYGSQLSAAVGRLTYEQVSNLTYEQFREIALSIIDTELPGWRQVALLMVFGQKVIWNALQNGQKQFGGIIDLCTQLVADVAADFIIKQGGWNSVMNFDPSQSSDTVSSAELDSSNDMNEFFSSHNITQVDSHDTATVTDSENQPAGDTSCEIINHQHDIDSSVPKYQHGHPRQTTNDSTQELGLVASSLDDSETFAEVDDIENGEATGLHVPIDGPFDKSINKSRYASSVGFEVDDSAETNETEDTFEARNDDKDGLFDDNSSVFYANGSHEDNLTQLGELNDLKSHDLDTKNKLEQIKHQTTQFSSYLDRHVISEHNNNHMEESDKPSSIGSHINSENATEHIGVDEDLITNISDEQTVQTDLDLSNDISSISQSDTLLNDTSPSLSNNDLIDSGINTYSYDTEDVSTVTDSVGTTATISENSDNSREVTDGVLPCNQREVTGGVCNQRETTHDNLSNLSQNSDNSFDYVIYCIRRRRFQVCVLSIAALAVALGVKLVSAR